MSRRKARELAFKVIFQVDQVNADPRTAYQYLLEENKLVDSESEFSWALIEGCLQHQEEIDTMISTYANDWTIDRMSSVDRNLMRVASAEILFLEGSQAAIAIDEAIEISKKYGEVNSASFINAILDKINRNKQ
ncbi:MAG TPA: transcription antitermination factor NusB [Syntrophomonas sp.]|nr:transcription antitermination factor NusB [Syntrophomonas sp.]